MNFIANKFMVFLINRGNEVHFFFLKKLGIEEEM